MTSLNTHSEESEAFVSVDFINNYPCIFWISNWHSIPDGGEFRMKILSSWNPSSRLVKSIVLLQDEELNKTEVTRYEGDFDSFVDIALGVISDAESSYGLDFQKQDFTSVKNAEDFEKLLTN